jgi:uncharacterized membrane protein YidH (DUF202 family)
MKEVRPIFFHQTLPFPSFNLHLLTNPQAFLAWLRLSVYMSIVAVAIMCSFHLKHKPTAIERKLALPVGIVFWFISLACMVSGVTNYCRTVTRYSRRAALVQSGWKTEIVSSMFSVYLILVFPWE